jgi:hypothetical protein
MGGTYVAEVVDLWLQTQHHWFNVGSHLDTQL